VKQGQKGQKHPNYNIYKNCHLSVSINDKFPYNMHQGLPIETQMNIYITLCLTFTINSPLLDSPNLDKLEQHLELS